MKEMSRRGWLSTLFVGLGCLLGSSTRRAQGSASRRPDGTTHLCHRRMNLFGNAPLCQVTTYTYSGTGTVPPQGKMVSTYTYEGGTGKLWSITDGRGRITYVR
jgi:hypothetical protein